MIGLAQGPAWPCCGKLLQNWLPKSQFGTWWSVLSTSANVAGALGPIFTTYLAIKYHWSYGFMIPGCICMSVGYLAIIILRNRPSEIGLEDFEPNEYQIQDNLDNQEPEYEDPSHLDEEELSLMKKLKLLFAYPFFISICVSYFMVQLIKTLFSDWSQMYLIKSYSLSPYEGKFYEEKFKSRILMFCYIRNN